MDQTIEQQEKDMVISFLTMRKAVGWLGMLLPFALLLFNWSINESKIINKPQFVKQLDSCRTIYTPDGAWKTSISHYYYTTVGELFTGTLCAVALFMFTYVGFKKRNGDKWLSDSATTTLAGLFALGVIIFPASKDHCIKDNFRIFISSDLVGGIHLTFAVGFFLMLAMMSIINFRRTKVPGKFGNTWRDQLHLICGAGMLVCLALIALYIAFLEEQHIAWLERCNPVFSLEALALQLFGLSWLTKGRVDFWYVLRKVGLK